MLSFHRAQSAEICSIPVVLRCARKRSGWPGWVKVAYGSQSHRAWPALAALLSLLIAGAARAQLTDASTLDAAEADAAGEPDADAAVDAAQAENDAGTELDAASEAVPVLVPSAGEQPLEADGGLDSDAQAATEPAPPVVGVPPHEGAIEVSVRTPRTEAQRLQQSAEAVTVVDLRRAQRETADLGEVLARTQGVSVRRSGGLGSPTRFSLNGLSEDQVRFFIDGVPLELLIPTGIANVPVNLVQRIEIYRGVVPVRFGADALGGAVNLVTDQSFRNRLGVSYQAGSFGTHRVTLNGRYRHDRTGLVAGGSAFFDKADNDYKVDVEVPDARGRLSPALVRRFHDGYRAYGANLEVGVVDKKWARKLLLQGYTSAYDKELQHNVVMTVPYGEVHYGETVYGVLARYEVELPKNLELEVVANYAHRAIDFVDDSKWVYNWYGQRVRERRIRGEIESDPTDQTVWQNSGFARALLAWKPVAEHQVRLSSTPIITSRTGDERIQTDPNGRDPLTAKRDLYTIVTGLEYELNLFEERLSNVVFVKDYVYNASSEEVLPGGIFRARETDSHTWGGGNALRFKFSEWLLAKASYEYATRLPRPDEVFGNGVLIQPNLLLKPEVSHNANLGPHFELKRTSAGDFMVDVNGFLRESDKLIVLLGNDRNYTYQNVYKSRSLGVENAFSWVSPGRYGAIDGTLTWQDLRNASSQGTFGDFNGDRIPNRPYLFSSWTARLRFANLPGIEDAIEPYYNGRYVHEFYRGWESQGLRAFKQVVPMQVSHAIGVSYSHKHRYGSVTSTFEIDNLSDAQLFDLFGVQRPGRAYYLKLMGSI